MNRGRTIRISALITIPLLLVVLCFVWLASRPAWQLTAHNTPQGVLVEVHRENETQPTFTTVLEGQTVPREVERVRREELPAEVGTTTFYDVTLKPGRWILLLGETKLDIMERVLIVDDEHEILPATGSASSTKPSS